MRSLTEPYAVATACVLTFRMKGGCNPPPGAKPYFLATYFPPLRWHDGPYPMVTADDIARGLVRKACDYFMCSPQFLVIHP